MGVPGLVRLSIPRSVRPMTRPCPGPPSSLQSRWRAFSQLPLRPRSSAIRTRTGPSTSSPARARFRRATAIARARRPAARWAASTERARRPRSSAESSFADSTRLPRPHARGDPPLQPAEPSPRRPKRSRASTSETAPSETRTAAAAGDSRPSGVESSRIRGEGSADSVAEDVAADAWKPDGRHARALGSNRAPLTNPAEALRGGTLRWCHTAPPRPQPSRRFFGRACVDPETRPKRRPAIAATPESRATRRFGSRRSTATSSET